MINEKDFYVVKWGDKGQHRKILYKIGTFGDVQDMKYGRFFPLVEWGAEKDRDQWVFKNSMWDNQKYSFFRYYGRWSPITMRKFVDHITRQKILHKRVFTMIFEGDWKK